MKSCHESQFSMIRSRNSNGMGVRAFGSSELSTVDGPGGVDNVGEVKSMV